MFHGTLGGPGSDGRSPCFVTIYGGVVSSQAIFFSQEIIQFAEISPDVFCFLTGAECGQSLACCQQPSANFLALLNAG